MLCNPALPAPACCVFPSVHCPASASQQLYLTYLAHAVHTAGVLPHSHEVAIPLSALYCAVLVIQAPYFRHQLMGPAASCLIPCFHFPGRPAATESMMERLTSHPASYRRQTRAQSGSVTQGQRLTETAESQWIPVQPLYMSSRLWQLPVSM